MLIPRRGFNMILRRMADAIRGQDWFTAVLEVLIVVVGIFVGLQVDDWNTRRQEQALLDDYLDRLEDETKNNIEGYLRYVNGMEAFSDHLTTYFNHLRDSDQPSPDLEALSANLCRNGVMGTPTYDNSVLDEMISTGYLRLIKDKELVRSLQYYIGEQNRVNQAVVFQAPILIDAYDKFEPHRALRPLEESGIGNCDFDFSAFARNPQAASWVADAQRLHVWHMLNARSVLDALQETGHRFEAETVESDEHSKSRNDDVAIDR